MRAHDLVMALPRSDTNGRAVRLRGVRRRETVFFGVAS
jgi:hypothetical protein